MAVTTMTGTVPLVPTASTCARNGAAAPNGTKKSVVCSASLVTGAFVVSSALPRRPLDGKD
jgi:hypothetical protein